MKALLYQLNDKFVPINPFLNQLISIKQFLGGIFTNADICINLWSKKLWYPGMPVNTTAQLSFKSARMLTCSCLQQVGGLYVWEPLIGSSWK